MALPIDVKLDKSQGTNGDVLTVTLTATKPLTETAVMAVRSTDPNTNIRGQEYFFVAPATP